jgi:hypothetical protein
MAVDTSILDSVKKTLGIDIANTAFDSDLILHINSVITILTDLGIGPSDGFTVTSSFDTWATLLGATSQLNSVKSYVYLRVRMLFDPPTTSYLIEAMKQQIQEFEWRLNVRREGTSWTDPTTPVI